MNKKRYYFCFKQASISFNEVEKTLMASVSVQLYLLKKTQETPEDKVHEWSSHQAKTHSGNCDEVKISIGCLAAYRPACAPTALSFQGLPTGCAFCSKPESLICAWMKYLKTDAQQGAGPAPMAESSVHLTWTRAIHESQYRTTPTGPYYIQSNTQLINSFNVLIRGWCYTITYVSKSAQVEPRPLLWLTLRVCRWAWACIPEFMCVHVRVYVIFFLVCAHIRLPLPFLLLADQIWYLGLFPFRFEGSLWHFL